MSEITLITKTVPQKVVIEGMGGFTATAGQSVKLETSPAGQDIIDEEVPAGKVWRVYLSITINEEDA